MRVLLAMAAMVTAAQVSVVANAAIEQKTSAFVLCKFKKDVRTIRILGNAKGSENCTISYTKGGTEEVVAVNRTMSSCTSILKNIQSNLERSNWSCRGVNSAKVMSSTEVSAQ
jgi:hypothetical protein